MAPAKERIYSDCCLKKGHEMICRQLSVTHICAVSVCNPREKEVLIIILEKHNGQYGLKGNSWSVI